MVAFFRTCFGVYAQVADMKEVLDVYAVQPGTARILLSNLVSEEEIFVDGCTFQEMFQSLFQRNVSDRHAHFFRERSS